MRSLVLWGVLAFLLGPAPAAPAALAHGAALRAGASKTHAASAPSALAVGFAAPAHAQQAPLTENPQAKSEWKGPSGFWTNPHPAKGGAYRWRMMAVGGGLLLVTGFAMLRLVKRAGAERAARSRR